VKGSVVGTFLGTLIIGVLAKHPQPHGRRSLRPQLFKGALIVVAVFIMSRSAGDRHERQAAQQGSSAIRSWA